MDYNYPSIVALRFINFRSLGDVTIDMTKSPIVFLTGPNEIGKSSISFGTRLLGTNKDFREQKEFIRDGTAGWKIAAMFSDGAIVTRAKTPKGQCFEVYKPTGEANQMELTYRSEKLDDNTVPKEIQDYMGFCTEPETGELLNVRLYADQMLFLDTPSSTNYKVLQKILKTEGLYKAVQEGTHQSNELRRKTEGLEQKIAACNDGLRRIKLVDDLTPLTEVKARISQGLKIMQRVEEGKQAYRKVKEIQFKADVATRLSKVGTVDELLVQTLDRAKSTFSELQKAEEQTARYSRVGELKEVDLYELERFSTAQGIIDELHALDKENRKLELSKNLKAVDSQTEQLVKLLLETESLLGQLSDLKHETTSLSDKNLVDIELLEYLERAKGIIKNISEVSEEAQKHREKADEYHKKLHESGALFTTCPNCGELILLNNQEKES